MIPVRPVTFLPGCTAEAPDRSPLPKPRPAVGAAAEPALPGQGAAISLGTPPARPAAAVVAAAADPAAEWPPTRSPLPRPRPDQVPDLVAGAAAAAAAATPALALASTSAAAIAPVVPPGDLEASPVPKQRKGLFAFLKAGATRTQPDPGAITGRAGSVCGIPGVKGRALPPISSRVKGCGIADPVEVTSVDGIALVPAATLDCSAAEALNRWVNTAAKPSLAGKGGGLEALRVAASYNCRTRNNVPGAPISEHGRGKAIDISGFILASETELTLSRDFRRGSYSGALKAIHKAACGLFGTTLGPGSDGRHEDHLHMDTARYTSGGYCR